MASDKREIGYLKRKMNLEGPDTRWKDTATQIGCMNAASYKA
jgi:hypothetical protein